MVHGKVSHRINEKIKLQRTPKGKRCCYMYLYSENRFLFQPLLIGVGDVSLKNVLLSQSLQFDGSILIKSPKCHEGSPSSSENPQLAKLEVTQNCLFFVECDMDTV